MYNNTQTKVKLLTLFTISHFSKDKFNSKKGYDT